MWKYSNPIAPDELYHHGILGQKWGIRRYQNEDGSLTEAGKLRYGNKSPTTLDKAEDLAEKKMYKYSKRMLSNKKNYDETGKLTYEAADKWKKKCASLMNKQLKNVMTEGQFTKISKSPTKTFGDDFNTVSTVKNPAVKSAVVGTIIAGPFVGAVAGLMKNHKIENGAKVLDKKYLKLVKQLENPNEKTKDLISVMNQVFESFPDAEEKND